MKKMLFALLTVALVPQVSHAQDRLTTQFFSSPHTFNPALAGLMPTKIRGNANFRSMNGDSTQGPSTMVNASADIRIGTDLLPKRDAFGIGIAYGYEQFKENKNYYWNSRSATLSLAYHKSIDKRGKHSISFGAQATTVDKNVLITKTEVYKELLYTDFSVGAVYTGKLGDNLGVFGGYKYGHITEPFEFAFAGNSSRLDNGGTALAGMTLGLGGSNALYINAYMHNQADVTYLQAGGYARIHLNAGKKAKTAETALYIGGYYKHDDAVAPYLGVEYADFRFAASYDINISDKAPAYKNNGGLEFSVTYAGAASKKKTKMKYGKSRMPELF
jgi:type IX secretion system PorP/SprF family membrane protein